MASFQSNTQNATQWSQRTLSKVDSDIYNEQFNLNSAPRQKKL